MSAVWYCTRQEAGPLVKECRALRPRLTRYDSPYERALKNKVLHPARDSAVCHTPVDRLELRLALMGWDATHYTLTFDDDHLPPDYKDARRQWHNFCLKLQRHSPHAPMDYIRCIEGKHGDHRYHYHIVLRDQDFSPAEIRHLWVGGEDVDDEPVLRQPRDSFARLARYFNKERSDGIVLPIDSKPWTCSRSLTAQLPAVQRWEDSSGVIEIPDNVFASGRNSVENEFGSYYYAWYIKPKQSLILK